MAIINATGLYTPEYSVSNDELVEAFNLHVNRYNTDNHSAIEKGELKALPLSSSSFIEKASGIKSRYLVSKEGVLDPTILTPLIKERSNDEPSLLAEMSVKAAQQALEKAGRQASDIDIIIVACSNLQRAYPAISIEVQQLLGAGGYAFDMNVACSSATFGIKTATDAIRSGTAKSVLVISPEVCSGHLNFKDRDSHFIFGDAATAILIEDDALAQDDAFSIIDTRCVTQFSNNIRNNFGFLNRTSPDTANNTDKLFVQNGRSVFKEVCPMVSKLINTHIDDNNIEKEDIKRLWLHQANLSMNQLIAKNVLGKEFDREDAPIILDTYANTSSAGSIIALHKYSQDFEPGKYGVICSFGAGYSAGSVILQKR